MQENNINKQKVLFLITKGNFGGAQKYVFDLATNLPKDLFETMVACGEGGTLSKLLKEKGIRAVEINKLVRDVKFFDEFKVCKKLINLIRLEKPNVIHLNSSKIGGIGAVAGRMASFFEKNYNPKIIFTAHNWGFNDKNRTAFEKLFYYLSHWVTALLCHQIICVSEKTKNDIEWLPFIKNKIKVIYNGIENFETLERGAAREKIATNGSQKKIIFSIAELHRNKGIDIALKALALLPKEIKEKIIFSIAGSGEEKENLEKLALELKLIGQENQNENLVNFLGFVPEAKKLLSGADLFLLPSRTEAFPYAILEAGLVGLPTIATSVGGIPEVIHDMQNGILIHPKNPKEIAEAIMYLLDRPEKMEEYGFEIKKTVATFFSLDKMLSETIAIYSQNS